ncbi:MAG: hypothetical protein AAF682_16310 [Planctomycetota bacterium]
MRTSLFAGGIFAGLTLLAAPAFAGGELTDAEKSELKAAFERALVADVQAELTSVAERKQCGEKAICEETGECNLECNCAPAGELFAYHLQAKPAGWKVVGPMVKERFADRGTAAADKERMLDLLAWAGAQKPAVALSEKLHEMDAKAFNGDHVLAFAESGSETMFKEAKARAKSDLRCAALVAMKGGEVSEKTLAKATKQKLSDDTALIDAYTAAAALKKMGNKDHWSRLQERVHDEVITALDDGAIDRARDLTLAAEFCVKSMSKGKGYGLSYLDSRLGFHRSLRSGDVAEADQVFELIEKVSPL